jgi:hypothetical protein
MYEYFIPHLLSPEIRRTQDREPCAQGAHMMVETVKM